MDYTLNIVSKCRFFFIFKHSRAPKRSWKIFHGVLEIPGKVLDFLSVKEWESCSWDLVTCPRCKLTVTVILFAWLSVWILRHLCSLQPYWREGAADIEEIHSGTRVAIVFVLWEKLAFTFSIICRQYSQKLQHERVDSDAGDRCKGATPVPVEESWWMRKSWSPKCVFSAV